MAVRLRPRCGKVGRCGGWARSWKRYRNGPATYHWKIGWITALARSGARLIAEASGHRRFYCRELKTQVRQPAFKQLNNKNPRRRNPLVQIILISLVCVLGIGSRRYSPALPGLIAAYAGDTLWALAAFLGIGLVLPRASTWRAAILAMTFSVVVELTQLYHAPWIDSIRQTNLGGLILGFGFLWSDLACYAVGIGIGVILEWIALIARKSRSL